MPGRFLPLTRGPFLLMLRRPRTKICFASMVAGRQPTPNLWTDAWLAALARSLDHELVTFDRGFKSFDGIKLNLLNIEGE